MAAEGILAPTPRWSLLALAALPLLACGVDEEVPVPPARACKTVIWARPQQPGEEVSVAGSWDDWAAPLPLSPFGEEDWQYRLMDLSPGDYHYRLVEEGRARLDPENPLSEFEGNIEVSLLSVPDCSAPAISIDRVEADDQGHLTLQGTFLTAREGGPPLQRSLLRATLEDGSSLSPLLANPYDGSFLFPPRASCPASTLR